MPRYEYVFNGRGLNGVGIVDASDRKTARYAVRLFAKQNGAREVQGVWLNHKREGSRRRVRLFDVASQAFIWYRKPYSHESDDATTFPWEATGEEPTP